jgi:hypothetical protein
VGVCEQSAEDNIWKRGKVIGIWKKLHNEEFCLQSSPIILRMIVRKMRLAVNIACTGEKKAYRVWVGTPGGRRTTN